MRVIDLNYRPMDYESSALPTELTRKKKPLVGTSDLKVLRLSNATAIVVNLTVYLLMGQSF